jgi:hypothetical protein
MNTAQVNKCERVVLLSTIFIQIEQGQKLRYFFRDTTLGIQIYNLLYIFQFQFADVPLIESPQHECNIKKGLVTCHAEQWPTPNK